MAHYSGSNGGGLDDSDDGYNEGGGGLGSRTGEQASLLTPAEGRSSNGSSSAYLDSARERRSHGSHSGHGSSQGRRGRSDPAFPNAPVSTLAKNNGEEPDCWDRMMDKLRSYFLFHLGAFIAHYLGFAIAIFVTVAGYFFHHQVASASGGVNLLAIISVFVDIYLLDYHYEHESYFPYCAAPHLLFMTKRKRVDPCPPPDNTLYISEKLLIFWQGFIFAVVPLNNLIAALRAREANKNKSTSDFEHFLLAVILIQLIVTLVGWVFFYAFYLVFVFELITRICCFPCCAYRNRTNTEPVPSDDHILASHISDPIYYKPYAWLYERM